MIFSCVFKTFSWTSFFSIFLRLGAKKVDFGSPLLSWVQNGVRNRTSGAKKAQIELDGLPILAPNFQDRFPERSWVPFWLILGPPWLQNHDFRMICWYIALHAAQNWPKFSIILIQLSMHFWRPNLQTTKAACHYAIGHAIIHNPRTAAHNAARRTLLAILQEPPRTAKNQKQTNADNQTQNFNSVSTNRCQ